ncbi:DUF4235 domain-containing protein [Aeromicrobium marinum]|uniref:DUF4235 domain-containing protein n=1 Tax=Aeromicrobium marinum TaxID=219314 RepID=UPI00145EE47D|nr:DUF4235 domain-containing protein [Aeromicrobium marinum]
MARKRSKPTTPQSPAPTSKTSGKAAWTIIDRSSMIAAGVLAPVASAGAWRMLTGRKPPTIDGDPDVDVKEAIAWALVGGALVEVVKVVARRQAAVYWVRSTGERPPKMKPRK